MYLGAFIASLPLTSLLAMIWLFQETDDATRNATLSSEIFWLLLPALGIAAACTVAAYAAVSLALHRFALKA